MAARKRQRVSFRDKGSYSRISDRAADASAPRAHVDAVVPAFYGVFFLALLLACSPVLDSKFSLPKLIALSLGACALSVLLMVRCWRGGLIVPSRPMLFLALALAGWWVIATPFALHVPTALDGEYDYFNGLWTHLCCLGLFVVSMLIASDASSVRRIVTALVLAILPVALVNIAETSSLTSFGLKEVSTLGDRVAASALMNFAIPIAAVALIGARRWHGRAAWGAVLLVLLVSEFLSRGRGAWIGLVVALFILVIGLTRSHARWKALTILAAGIVLTAGVAASLNPTVAQRLATFGSVTQDEAIAQRFIYYRAAIRAIHERPVAGIGFENFRNGYPRYRGADDIYFFQNIIPTMVHNGYLEMAVNSGIPALLLYLALITVVLIGLCREISSEKDPERHGLLVGILAALGAYLVQDLSGWRDIALAAIFWILLGLAAGLTSRTTDGTPQFSTKLTVAGFCLAMVCLSLPLLVNGYHRLIADALLFKAQSLDVKAQWRETERLVKDAISVRPEDRRTAYVAGQIYADRFVATRDPAAYASARELLEASYRLNQYDRLILVNIVALEIEALEQARIGKATDFARTALDTLTRTDGDNPRFHEFRARFHAARGDLEAALTAMRYARSLAPQDDRLRSVEAEYQGRLAARRLNIR